MSEIEIEHDGNILLTLEEGETGAVPVDKNTSVNVRVHPVDGPAAYTVTHDGFCRHSHIGPGRALELNDFLKNLWIRHRKE